MAPLHKDGRSHMGRHPFIPHAKGFGVKDVLVIGAGGVSSVAVHKMAKNPELFGKITLASRRQFKCDAIAKSVKERFGVDICVGDTRGPAGIFRFLRTAPVMKEICEDVERYCPGAVVLNYTNPMAMLCRYLQSETKANAMKTAAETQRLFFASRKTD